MEEPLCVKGTQTDYPTETDKFQVKCIRLENKVKTLEDVCSIRQNLLEIRERESKELVRRLKSFEDDFSHHQASHGELRHRMHSADVEYKELTGKMSANLCALDNAKTQYENRLRGLTIQLDQAAISVQNISEENRALKKELLANRTETTILQDDLAAFEEEKEKNEIKIMCLEELLIECKNEKTEIESIRKENVALTEEIQRKNVAEEKASEIIERLQIELEEANANNTRVQNLQPAELAPITDTKDVGIPRNECQPSECEIIPHWDCTMFYIDEFSDRLEEGDTEYPQIPGQESCYTPSHYVGGKPQLSVSRTFIKLKDLILEKKGLKKEIESLNRLRQKLDTKLDKESRRLYHVTLELNKTWHLVSKLKSECGQLHTFKSVHRYELQEQRRMLEKLKRDLSISREKFLRARKKGRESQLEWESIRDEFKSRRLGKGIEKSSISNAERANPLGQINHMTSNDSKDDVGYLAEELATIQFAVIDNGRRGELEGAGICTYEEVIQRRAQRLEELEEQCRLLYDKLRQSQTRNNELVLKLAKLHSHYGSSSEDSIVEGDEHEFQSEITSGDTAYASESGQDGTSNPEDDGTTEVPSESEDDTSEILRVVDQLSDASSIVTSNTEENFGDDMSNAMRIDDTDTRNQLNDVTTINLHLGNVENSNYVVNHQPTDTFNDHPQEFLQEVSRILNDVQDENTDTNNPSMDAVELTSLTPLAPPELILTNDTLDAVDGTTILNSSVEYQGIEGEESGSTDSSSSNTLSKVLIQQFPKIFNHLRDENSRLKSSLNEELNEKEVQLSALRIALAKFQLQLNSSMKTEMELRNDLDLKQRLIQELTTKIQMVTESSQTISRDHEKMKEYFKIKMQDTKIQEQRKLVKMRQMKACGKCNQKFTLFRRRSHCATCGHSFCSQCLVESLESFSLTQRINSRESVKKVLACTSCDERRRRLQDVVKDSEKWMQI